MERNRKLALTTLVEYRMKRNDVQLFHIIIHHTRGNKMSGIMTLRTANTRSGYVRCDPGGAKLTFRLNFFTFKHDTSYD